LGKKIEWAGPAQFLFGRPGQAHERRRLFDLRLVGLGLTDRGWID
jgi:hypothetical protein